ncbi:MAG: MBL fold metallo-hydrolase [Coriobacteriia bacterium]|nr:MBL fold metallo-hydrolase [Coriobacteriia bacterium]MBN2821919.1 MBL fold metallo-hydrolase [Coriobacteriia bacterium]
MTLSKHPETGCEFHIAFLGSGSRGNCIAVCSADEVILVDAGLSARETRRRMAEAGVDEANVCGILLTHEHSDHVAGVRVLAKCLDVPVLATAGTIEGSSHLAAVKVMERIRPDDDFTIGSLKIRAFRTSHDAVEPVGYAFEDARGVRFGLASDTGHVPAAALEVLQSCSMVGLESNHDVNMVRTGPYPAFLKNRILSATGHLSNDDAALVLERLIESGVRSVCAVHLSEQNNRPQIVRETLEACVHRLGADTRIIVASQHTTVTCSG